MSKCLSSHLLSSDPNAVHPENLNEWPVCTNYTDTQHNSQPWSMWLTAYVAFHICDSLKPGTELGHRSYSFLKCWLAGLEFSSVPSSLISRLKKQKVMHVFIQKINFIFSKSFSHNFSISSSALANSIAKYSNFI